MPGRPSNAQPSGSSTVAPWMGSSQRGAGPSPVQTTNVTSEPMARAHRCHGRGATSRVVLHVSGEHVYPVAPLPETDAVELFIQRAQGHDPAFVADETARPVVASICRRLDGLPLPIELAAARVRTLGLRVLDARAIFQRVRVQQPPAFDDVERVAVEVAGAVEPGLVVELGDVDHQRVAFPARA